jgi:hypothetical protein
LSGLIEIDSESHDIDPSDDSMIQMKKIKRHDWASAVLFSVGLSCLLCVYGATAQDVPVAGPNPVSALVQPWVDKNMIPGALVFLGTRDEVKDVEFIGYQDISRIQAEGR